MRAPVEDTVRHDLAMKVAVSASRSRDPIYTAIELTYRCNYRCPHCYVDRSAAAEELGLRDWTRIFREMRSSGCFTVVVTGGEPLTRPDALPVLQELKNTGFVTTLFTNASLVDEPTARQLAELGLGEVGVSIYGADGPTHDAFTGVSGSFDRVMKSVTLLRDAGCRVALKWNAVPATVHQTERFIDLAEKLGVRWQANSVIVVPRDRREPSRVSDQELYDFYAVIIRRGHTLAENRRDAEVLAAKWREEPDPEMPVCGAGRTGTRIDPRGEVYGCVDIEEPAGSAVEHPFSELWRDSHRWERFTSLRMRDLPTCRSCPARNICKRICPGMFMRESGSYGGESRENCRNTFQHIRALHDYLAARMGTRASPLREMMEVINGPSNTGQS
jgi:radical SAM protein with 4Fe4S-binding SPASM domain